MDCCDFREQNYKYQSGMERVLESFAFFSAPMETIKDFVAAAPNRSIA